MADEQKPSFLGIGWGYPVTFLPDPVCSVRMVSDVEDIKESLTILLSTRPGERIMRPDYGCAMEDLLFESVNLTLITYIKNLIEKAILYFEPRIDLENIEINTDTILEGQVLIELEFSVRTTNSRFNYVYDYYKQEATIRPQ